MTPLKKKGVANTYEDPKYIYLGSLTQSVRKGPPSNTYEDPKYIYLGSLTQSVRRGSLKRLHASVDHKDDPPFFIKKRGP